MNVHKQFNDWIYEQVTSGNYAIDHKSAWLAYQQAHREGWEQGKKEAFEIARTTQIGKIQTTIAAMEYGGSK